MADLLRLLDKTDLDQVGDIAAVVENFAWTHGITADPEPIDAFVADVNRLCDQEITFDRTEMLLIKLTRAGIIDDSDSFAMHAAHLAQQGRAGGQDVKESDAMLEESRAIEAASRRALEMRQASGRVQLYEVDGWMVYEHPGGRIERLAPTAQFHAADHPYPGWTPPEPMER